MESARIQTFIHNVEFKILWLIEEYTARSVLVVVVEAIMSCVNST